MKTIFFIAVTGSLGQFWAMRLLEEGYFLIFMVRSKNGLTAEQRVSSALAFVDPEACVKYRDRYVVLEGDLFNYPEVDRKIDILCNAAGETSFSDEDVFKTVRVNIDAVKPMLNFVEKYNIPEIHDISTAYVYEQGVKVAEEIWYDSHKAQNIYAKTKGVSEYIKRFWMKCRKNKKVPCKIFIYRPSIIVGHSLTGFTINFFGYYRYMRAFYVIANGLARKNAHLNRAIELPIHVSGEAGATINIVTIDYVIEMLIRLQKAGIPGIYNITNANAPEYEWLLKESLMCLNIKGPSSARDPQDTPKELKRLEQKLQEGVADYIPFVTGNVVFDQSNCKKVLGDKFIEHQKITPRLIKTLMDFAVSCEFRRENALSKAFLKRRFYPPVKT